MKLVAVHRESDSRKPVAAPCDSCEGAGRVDVHPGSGTSMRACSTCKGNGRHQVVCITCFEYIVGSACVFQAPDGDAVYSCAAGCWQCAAWTLTGSEDDEHVVAFAVQLALDAHGAKVTPVDVAKRRIRSAA